MHITISTEQMRIKEIQIDNFACFKHFEAKFTPGVNVVIGRNGTGKTSLIKGLVYTLNFIFTNDKSMGDNYLSSGNPDLKMSSVRFEEFYRDKEAAEVVAFANFHGTMEWEGKNFEWDMFKKSLTGSSLNPAKYVEAYRQFMSIARDSGNYPLLAFFSDSFPHKQNNISSFAKNEINNTEGILRNFGYYQWDNETSCTMIWQLRLVNVLAKDLSLGETESSVHREVSFVTDRLKKFSQIINEDSDDSYEIEKVFFSFKDGEKPELWLKLKSGTEIRFNSLPAGYLRLYSIVLDLAYRSYLLNRNTTGKVAGVVLIDEIDLHLHPSLELEVVERFTHTFPDVQFIMTTHSPLVITNLSQVGNGNQILRLVSGEEKPHELPDVFGIDYNTGLDVMGVNATNQEVEFLKNLIVRCHRRGDKVLLEKKKEELKNILSDSRYDSVMEEISRMIKN